ncbi:hypothetical protein [Halomonas sp. DQ26W]|uniref:hypothetical protein n=1 Tax=Halomonas sp. DQ26W TaxID=2282311 RepID=UPI0015F1203D|nr:hypothetical protein [Halomonas sp. DQ26W]
MQERSWWGMAALSGAFVAMALTGMRGLGMITPVGGLLMIGGWLTLAVYALRDRA